MWVGGRSLPGIDRQPNEGGPFVRVRRSEAGWRRGLEWMR